MSNKIVNSALISKKKPIKKQLTEEELARLQNKFVDPAQNSSRRRLKKLSEVNPNEQILNNSEQEDNQTQKLDGLDQYKQFDLKDDEDIKKQLQQQIGAKKNKKLKGNQQIDKFIEKNIKNPIKESKQQKPKVENKQLTLFDMARIKKQKKAKRKSSDQFEFIVNDNGSISEQINEEEIQAKRLAAYQIYNGSTKDQKQLIQQAMKLSLATASAQKSLNNQKFQYYNQIDPCHQIGKPVKPNTKKQKPKQKKQIKNQEIKNKQSKVKSKSTIKQKKQGPLSGLIIVFTGQFEMCSKDELIEVCEQLGAECPKSLTKKCQILIQGSYVIDHYKRRSTQLVTQTAKSMEAKQRGLQIISYQQINNFFISKTGFGIQHHVDNNKVKINPMSFMYKIEEQQNNLPNFDQQKPQKMQIEIEQKNQLVNNKEKSHISKIKQQAKMQIQNRDIKTGKDYRLWTQKYKPQKLEEVIGQNSQIKSLREWLQSWEDIHIRGNKRQIKQSKGWNSGSINSKAALISGDPGIGKTTTARLLAAQYHYSVSQFNASDIRNKSGVNMMETGSYNLDQSKNLNKSLIIMDEVDGMSSGDRGGITAIINLIKTSKVPIICICNDRQSQKIRSLAGHCLDVKFFKPHKGMLVQKLKSILVAQGGSGQDRALDQLIEAFQNDMRQILSYLEVIFKNVSKRITLDALSSKNKHSKDSSVMINHFDAARKLLNRTEFCRMKIQERTQCFFVDSDMVPLLIHENILNSAKKTKYSLSEFHGVVEGLKGMVIGDLLDRTIRKQQEWELMPSFGFMTCVYSTEKISQSIGFPQFPTWLGKFSSQRKVKRLSKEFKDYTYPQTLCSNWKAVKSLYVPLVINELIQLLKQENIQKTIQFMQAYNITPAIITEHLTSLNFSTDKANPLASIPTAIRTKLTKSFNKRHEDSKLKQINKKTNKGKGQDLKYNAVLQQGQNEIDQQQMEQQKQQSEVVIAKGKTKAPKKK